MKTTDAIQIILYDKNYQQHELVRQYLALPGKTFHAYASEDELGQLLRDIKDQGHDSKEVLILKYFKGRLFQKCPGSPVVICCNYYLINTCFDCLYNCMYCFLHSYLNFFGMTQFINVEDVIGEMKQLIAKEDKIYRIGTGEFTDSLMMDEVTGLAFKLIDAVKDMPQVFLEFKTKSKNVDHLLDIQEKGNTVLAWSLNTERNIELFEEDTATLDERLKAARKAQDAGYYLAFHFDPIIIYDNFMKEYHSVIDRLFAIINPDKVVWISMGGFRYAPGFKEDMRTKFPRETLTLEEMFPGQDGKYRYFMKKRVELYRQMKAKLDSYITKTYLYLCMESSDVWYEVFGVDFQTDEDLEQAFLDHLQKYF